MADSRDQAWEKMNSASREYNRNPNEKNKKKLQDAQRNFKEAEAREADKNGK